ncbi:MAG: diguanylate cyclase [Desulfobulbaceae bacterium]|nr:diguanylate cyclase [Desulfobulbaceae bacterium]
MPRDVDNAQCSLPKMLKSSDFVRKYLLGIFLVIGLILLSVFWGFSYRSNTLIKGQLLKQGQAFFEEMVITREWAAKHGGVYVKITPETLVNPYLLKIPGLKVVIKDEDGVDYTLKNPALMTRELSEIANRYGIFRFKITSLNPFNPANKPDLFEQSALTSFNEGKKEYSSFEQENGEVFFRYMAPLVTSKACLQCHAQQGYKEGDVRGGISVSIPATTILKQINVNRYAILFIALGIVGLLYAMIRYVTRIFIGDLNRSEQQLQEMASHDYLTHLFNRRAGYQRISEEMVRSARTEKPLVFILLDIDYFKRLNDSHGHTAGDMVLHQLACTLLEALRDYDIACRYGGEEFLVVAPETSVEQGLKLAERLRATIAGIHFNISTQHISITVSVGVSRMEEHDSIEDAISRADTALYQAKNGGRNRVCVAGESAAAS